MKKFLLLFAFVAAAVPAFAAGEEGRVAVLFTGRTHAMIYPCNCPFEPAGGVRRRATEVKRFASGKIPFVLVDAGDSFAGGLMDQYSQGEELDKLRTEVNLRAMEAMGYACAAVGESELDFGWDYFAGAASKTRFPFVSSNIRAECVRPYVVRKAGSTLIGITAVSPRSIEKKLPQGAFLDPEEAARDAVGRLKAQGCGLVVLMSDLDENESVELAKKIQGIDILILNKPRDDSPVTGLSALVLKTAWQGRRLDEALLALAETGIQEMRLSEVLLSEKVPDDPAVSKIVPVCMSDLQCHKQGYNGVCVDPGKRSAQCSFTPAPKVKLVVIWPKECLTCRTDDVIKGVADRVPGLDVVRLAYPGAEAGELMKKLKIDRLPAYLFDRSIENEKVFGSMKPNLLPEGEYYRLDPDKVGFGFYVSRPRIVDRLDVFMSVFDKGSRELLEELREFSPEIHFIVIPEGANGEYGMPHGKAEMEEDLRALCIKKYYPGFFYPYLTCRARDPESSWWDSCLDGLDIGPVRGCALGDEGKRLLEENTALTRELEIRDGPTFLFENREIFKAAGTPGKEGLRRLLIRK